MRNDVARKKHVFRVVLVAQKHNRTFAAAKHLPFSGLVDLHAELKRRVEASGARPSKPANFRNFSKLSITNYKSAFRRGGCLGVSRV